MEVEQQFPIDRLQVEGLKELHQTKVEGIGSENDAGALEGGGLIIDGNTIEIKLTQLTIDNIAKGVEAHEWGDHSTAGYLKSDALSDYITEQEAEDAFAPKLGYPDWAFQLTDMLNF